MNTIIQNKLFRQCLSSVPAYQKEQFNRSFDIAEKLDTILKEKGMSYSDLALLMGKNKNVILSWMTGRHSFTKHTIAQIEDTLGCQL